MDRRTFMKQMGIGGGLVAAAPWLLSDAHAGLPPELRNLPSRQGKLVPPDRKMNIAVVGCGGKGYSDLHGVASENIVALCDVDMGKGQKAFMEFPDAKHYRDFRKMLYDMDDQIEAVVVSTPDHMHFTVAMMAVTMGKHVFVQKPLCRTIWEARTLTLAARKHNVVTQMGIQGHTKEGIRLLKEWLDADAIGKVHEIQYWTNRPIWPQGMARPAGKQEPPATLDWNLWLGSAPWRPYNNAYCPFKWRGWWDFGCGALGDIGCHAMDAGFFALNLGAPTSVEAVTSGVNEETAPKWSIVTYEFPARGDLPPVKVVWHDGDKKPERPKDLEAERKLPGGIGGQLFFGEKGTIMASDSYCSSLRLIPEKKMQAFAPNRPPKTLPRSPGVYKEWINGCKGGPTPGANFDYSGPLTEMVVLGNLAVRSGKKVEWDAEKMLCTNVPEANKYVRQPYRVF